MGGHCYFSKMPETRDKKMVVFQTDDFGKVYNILLAKYTTTKTAIKVNVVRPLFAL